MALDKEAFISIGTRHAVKEVPLPGADGDMVYVRKISAGERDMIEGVAIQFGRDPASVKQYRAKCVAAFLSDENGKRMFRDNELAHLDGMDAEVIDAIFEEGMIFNGMLKVDLEELEKN